MLISVAKRLRVRESVSLKGRTGLMATHGVSGKTGLVQWMDALENRTSGQMMINFSRSDNHNDGQSKCEDRSQNQRRKNVICGVVVNRAVVRFKS